MNSFKTLFTVLTSISLTFLSAQTSQFSFPQSYGYWKYKVYDDYWNHIGWTSESLYADSSGAFPVLRNGSFAITLQNDKVYRVINDSTLWLLFDFGLTVGDTFHYNHSLIGDSIGIVVAVGNSPAWGGRKAIQLISNFGGAPAWIEGIGNINSYFGVFEPLNNNSISGGWQFECLYADSASYPCQDAFQLSVEEPLSAQLQPYPNPTKGKLYFENTLHNIDQINIFSLTGNDMSRMAKLSSDKSEIDISALSTGMYILELRSKSRIIQYKISLVH